MTYTERVFVFGSNLAGRHGAGSALHAKNIYGAEIGVGVGRTGNAYAIPTKDKNLETLSLLTIQGHIKAFIRYAKAHPEIEFAVVKVGCGLAGYQDKDIAPFFANVPDNCLLHPDWHRLLSRN